MAINLWGFLTLAAVFGTLIPIVGIYATHKKKMKELEIEALKIQQLNLKNEVNDAVKRNIDDLAERLEVLEAIITDKTYELNEKFSKL